LGLEFEETPLVTRFHQLMNEAGCSEESNRETAVAVPATAGEMLQASRVLMSTT
jgi:hypothetical protein